MGLFRRRPAAPSTPLTAPVPASAPRRLAENGTPDNPHAHLDPVVAAELAWGNRGQSGWTYTPQVDEWTYSFWKPFHVDLLRAHFVFPPRIRLCPSGPTRERITHLYLGNGEDRISMSAPVPHDWSAGWEPLPLPRPADVIADEQKD